jgi:hypothetical protein
MLGISLPNEVLSKIDKDRGPIPRSRFLLKLIEIAYNTNTIIPQERFMIIKEKNALSDGNLGGEASDKTEILIRRKPHEYSE